jgi:hypothetical protein
MEMYMTFIKHAALVALLSIVLASCSRHEIRPFTSDGCSAFPDGTLEQKELWLSCCTTHDIAYWKGGTYKERLQSDKDLQMCVEGIGEPEVALLMFTGVRVGGTPYLPTTFRWGYGWPYPRAYGELNALELEQIKKQSIQ